MTNAERFIDLVGKLYNMTPKQTEQMENNVQEIDAQLSKYSWDDIKAKTNLFYARKNDKSRPHLHHILALLESDPAVQPVEPVIEPKPVVFNVPTTSIWSIRETFDKLVQVLTDGGVLPGMDGNFGIKRSLVDPKTNNVVICPRQWLGWQMQDAMKARPDLFAKFNNLSWLEQLAIAVQNKLVVFKVRDWAKLAQEMPTGARNGNEWHNYTKNLQIAM